MNNNNDEVVDGEIIDPEEENKAKTNKADASLGSVIRNPVGAVSKAHETPGVLKVGTAAAVGAVVGSIIPGVGTMIGAGIGGIIGGSVVVAQGIKEKMNPTDDEIQCKVVKPVCNEDKKSDNK